MRKCPQCGFVGTISGKRMLGLMQAHFPDLPVMEMVSRGWISVRTYSQWRDRDEWCEDEVPQMLGEVLKELMRFFEVGSVEELKALLGWEGDLMDTDKGPRNLRVPLPLFDIPQAAENAVAVDLLQAMGEML